jgi:hypothetical protein
MILSCMHITYFDHIHTIIIYFLDALLMRILNRNICILYVCVSICLSVSISVIAYSPELVVQSKYSDYSSNKNIYVHMKKGKKQV